MIEDGAVAVDAGNISFRVLIKLHPPSSEGIPVFTVSYQTEGTDTPLAPRLLHKAHCPLAYPLCPLALGQ